MLNDLFNDVYLEFRLYDEFVKGVVNESGIGAVDWFIDCTCSSMLYVWHPLIYARMYLFVDGWMDRFMYVGRYVFVHPLCIYVNICMYVSINGWTCVWIYFFDDLYLEFWWWNEFVKWVVKESDVEAFHHFCIVHVVTWLDACVYACMYLLMCVCTRAQQIVHEWSWWYQFWETVNFSFL